MSDLAAGGALAGSPALPPRSVCDYAPFWCEENVARLLGRPELAGRRAWALLVSNPSRTVALLRQRAGNGPRGLVIWDYHVVACVAVAGARPLVLDLDSSLGYPLPAREWAEATIPKDRPESQAALFRLVPAELYLRVFSSDRSHMRRADGSWQAPPPPWPAFGAGGPNTLMELIDMARPRPGEVLDRAGLQAFATTPCP